MFDFLKFFYFSLGFSFVFLTVGFLKYQMGNKGDQFVVKIILSNFVALFNEKMGKFANM